MISGTVKALRREEGMALVLVMTASMFLVVLGSSLMVETITETTISSNYRDGVEAFHAAEAGAGLAMARLVAMTSWTPQAAFVSGRVEDLMGVPRSSSPISVSVSLLDAGVADRIVVLSRADGPGQARRTIRVTLARPIDPTDHLSLRTVAWEELR